MKYDEKKLLIDSNSYFRLAKSLHPLLNNKFGNENYCIYILKECDQEYSKNPGLRNKFGWVNQKEFKENRKKRLSYSASTDNGIFNNMRFIRLYAQENYLNISEVDIKYLATAFELEIILITDDGDMIVTAKEYGIQVMKSLDLLKLMLDSTHINIEKVIEITEYWIYINDTPKNFKEDCKTLFNIKY